ncbi:MAG: AzlD domain-containing protein [Comamonas sp.]
MTGDWWFWIALASAIAYATKLLGYMVPARWLHHPRMARVAGSLTVALLAALTAMNTVASGQQLVLDARVAALVVAGIALALRLPFLLVVVLGAAASALVRWLL